MHDDLARLIERHSNGDGIHASAVPRLHLVRASQTTEPLHMLYKPALCIIAQGRKHVMAGNRVLAYDRAQYLIVSVELPIVGQIVQASAAQPYLCIRLDLDPVLLGELLLQSNHAVPAAPAPASGPALSLSAITPDLLEAATRLLRLLDTPRDIAVLAPLLERELMYRLLIGEQGHLLRQIVQGGGRAEQINRAIAWIKRNYTKQFKISRVAAEARMSASALHLHFKAVTAMTPLQYQKQLRLQEARRLIVANGMEAADAGHAVGYDSPSQFSREYSRVFGAPPMRDRARLLATPELAAASG